MSAPDAAPVSSSVRIGTFLAFGGFFLWGLSPLYWALIASVGAFEIVAHRIVWSALLAGLLIALMGGLVRLRRDVARAGVLPALALSSLLISGNWLLFVWATTNGHILQSSLGYYINPLVNVAICAFALGEVLTRGQTAAVGLAAIGVALLVVGLGTVPWIALALAVSFSVYGYIRKRAAIDPLGGVFMEALIALPLAAAVLWMAPSSLAHPPSIWALLVLTGPVTLVPLLLYNEGVKRIRLSTVGLAQYISPSVQFVLAQMVFGERLSPYHAAAFGFIWVGLAVFTGDSLLRQRSPAARTPG